MIGQGMEGRSQPDYRMWWDQDSTDIKGNSGIRRGNVAEEAELETEEQWVGWGVKMGTEAGNG